jgi:DNA-binding NarL/FixJ family response regulator
MPAPEPRRIAIADRSPAFLAAAANYVAALPGYALVGTATDAADLVVLVETAVPQVLLLDLGVAPARGFSAIRRIKALPRSPAVIALALFYSDEMATEARAAGADALVGKEAFVSGLGEALDRIFRQQRPERAA